MPLWRQRRSQDSGGPVMKPVAGRLMHPQWLACWRFLTAREAGTPHFPFAWGPANFVAGPGAAPPADSPASLRSGSPPIGGQGPRRPPGLYTCSQTKPHSFIEGLQVPDMGTEELGKKSGCRGSWASQESPCSVSWGHPSDPARHSGLVTGSKPSDFRITVRLLKRDANSHFEKHESKETFLLKTNLDSSKMSMS